MIEFIKLSFSYKDMEQSSLRELHLNIPKGQCVLLCGASGCGKTTLTRLVNGLIPHFFEGNISGKATVKGLNVAETEISSLSDSIGTVFQNPRTQFFNTDTDSEIVFGLENRMLETKELKQQLERVVKDLHIEKLKGCSIFELSGGEKQKIAFASIHPPLTHHTRFGKAALSVIYLFYLFFPHLFDKILYRDFFKSRYNPPCAYSLILPFFLLVERISAGISISYNDRMSKIVCDHYTISSN